MAIMTSQDFCQEMEARGLVHQVSSPELAAKMRSERFTAYAGFDPTAESLGVGNLVPLMQLVRLQRMGHRPIALLGGGTGLIGDPSGKQEERSLQTLERVHEHVAGIRRQIEHFLDLDGPNGALVVDNADWLCRLNLVEFLRDIGKHFSVNQMMVRDSVRTRLESREQGLSYTEFTYMLLQAYDYLALFDEHDCRLQLGGSDQWGNIVSGADLVRRLRGAEVYALTVPLIQKSDGTKFGKTAEGNVWLSAERTSPYQFYQFWLNADDQDVIRYLNIFTLLPVDQIGELRRATEAQPEQRAAQRVLAEEVTRLVHGPDALERAQRATEVLFRKDADFRELSAQELGEAFHGAPTSSLSRRELGTDAAKLVVLASDEQVGLYPSRGRARKDLPQGGLSVNNVSVRDPEYTLSEQDLLAGGYIILRKGKKHYHVLRVDGT
jgi:tyrosyl-tRNA synthetase